MHELECVTIVFFFIFILFQINRFVSNADGILVNSDTSSRIRENRAANSNCATHPTRRDISVAVFYSSFSSPAHRTYLLRLHGRAKKSALSNSTRCSTHRESLN